MSELFNYLNSPQLVANFQKIFGIESHFDTNDSSASIKTTSTSFAALTIQNNENDLKKRSKHSNESKLDTNSNTNVETIGPISHDSKHKRQSSNVKVLVNNTDHSHIVANTTIHNKFWFYLFHLGAAMGKIFIK